MWTINALTISSKVLDSFLVGFNTCDSEVFLCIIPLLICHTIFGSWDHDPSNWHHCGTMFPADFWTFLILILSLPRVYFSHDPVSPTNLPSSDLLQNGGQPPPRPMPGAIPNRCLAPTMQVSLAPMSPAKSPTCQYQWANLSIQWGRDIDLHSRKDNNSLDLRV